MERFYIVPKDCDLGKNYIDYKKRLNQITSLFKQFSMENNIQTQSFYTSATRLWIDPNDCDVENFRNGFMVDNPGKFKKKYPLSKKWVALCEENGLTKDVIKPYVPFYFSFGMGKCSYRLFDIDEVIYCTFSSESEFKASEGLIEIKGSEFYTAIEKYNEN